MIGVFDSGYGGLVILRGLVKRLPEHDYVYLGDNARAPYGPRSAEEIFAFTVQGVDWLFSQGCQLVILGCNTASASALRRIQQDVLPKRWPDKRVLGILVPTVEQIVEDTHENVIVFATEATGRSGAYTVELKKRDPSIAVHERACPEISPLVESGASREILAEAVARCTADLPNGVSTALLGCTHYGLIPELFLAALPPTMHVFDQSAAVADKTVQYLHAHPEIAARLEQTAQRRFATTGDAGEVSRLATRFFGQPATFAHIELPT